MRGHPLRHDKKSVKVIDKKRLVMRSLCRVWLQAFEKKRVEDGEDKAGKNAETGGRDWRVGFRGSVLINTRNYSMKATKCQVLIYISSE